MSTEAMNAKAPEIRRLHLNDSRELIDLKIAEALRAEIGERLIEPLRRFRDRGESAKSVVLTANEKIEAVIFLQEGYTKDQALVEIFFEVAPDTDKVALIRTWLYENSAQRFFQVFTNTDFPPFQPIAHWHTGRETDILKDRFLYSVERTELLLEPCRIFLYAEHYFIFKFSRDGQKLKSLLICPVGLTLTEPYFIEEFRALDLLSPHHEVLLDISFRDPRPRVEPLQTKLEEDLVAYLEGHLKTFDWPIEYPEDATEFQRSVWDELQKIPYAGVLSYEELAAKVVGREQSKDYARAIGTACASNPLMLVVPCHRVLGQGGELKGFRSGVATKAWLLDRELLQYRR